MNLSEYSKLIFNSQYDDWTIISCWGAGSGPSYRDATTVWTKGNDEFQNIEIDSHSEVFSFKNDLRISVSVGITHNDDFVEEWANKFPDEHASSAFVDFFFCNQLVFRDVYVVVDGGRCRIPLPKIHVNNDTYKIERLTVSKDKFEFFKLLNGDDDAEYMRYVRQTGIEVVDEPWII